MFLSISWHFSLKDFVYMAKGLRWGTWVSCAQAISERHGSATTRKQDLGFVVIRSRAHTYTKKKKNEKKKDARWGDAVDVARAEEAFVNCCVQSRSRAIDRDEGVIRKREDYIRPTHFISRLDLMMMS